MSELAVAGHGATIALEMDPVGSPGVFTPVGELNGDINWFSLSVPETNVTAHNDRIDFWIPGVLQREALSFTINYVFNDSVHEELIASVLEKTVRGFQLRGPSGSAGVDEWIASGFVQNLGPIVHPVREGARTAQVTIRLSGRMIKDGVEFGEPFPYVP